MTISPAQPIKNLTQLRDSLLVFYGDIRSGVIDRATAQEMTNAIGKLNSAGKLELEYFAMRKETPDIAFYRLPAEEPGVSTT